MKAVDLFAGAGGFSLGLMRAGFDVVLANEFSVDPEWTYRSNLLPHTIEGFPAAPTERTRASIRKYRSEAREALMERRGGKYLQSGDHMRGGDIREALSTSWLRTWKRGHQEIDLLVGGPPCQGFSSAGKRDSTDERNSLVKEMLRVALVIRPKVVVIENVPGMLTRHSDVLEYIVKTLARKRPRGASYRCAVHLLKGQDFGVPQTRRRLLVVGVRTDLARHIPTEALGHYVFPSACPAHLDTESPVIAGSAITSAIALGDLRSAPPRYDSRGSDRVGYAGSMEAHPYRLEMRTTKDDYLAGRVAQSLDEGLEHYANHERSIHSKTVAERMSRLREAAQGTGEGQRNRCSTGWLRAQYIREHPALGTKKVAQRVLLPALWPKLTVTSLPDDIVHYCEDRIPTVREMARLQTFPDWFRFEGVRTTGHTRRRAGVFVPQYTQVANAVPPRLSFAIACQVRDFLLEHTTGYNRLGDFHAEPWWEEHPSTTSDKLAQMNALAFSRPTARW